MVYNATPQSRTGESPYRVATGRDLHLSIDTVLSSGKVPAATRFSEDLITLWRNCKAKLETVQQQDKRRADRARRKVDI